MAGNASPGWMVPSARLWRMRLTQVAAAGPVLAMAAGLAAGISAGVWSGVAAAAAAAAAAGIVLWVERRRYRAWAYREREEDLIVSRGVLVRRVSVVPYGQMQFVEVTAGPFERDPSGRGSADGWRRGRYGPSAHKAGRCGMGAARSG